MFARTERLLLRPGWAEDAPALHQAIADEGIVRNLATAPWPYSFADAETFLMRERSPRDASCLIFLRGDGAPTLIGGVGFARTPQIGPAGAEIEFGYWIARPYWGNGYATEAGAALIANARETLRLPRLVAGHFTDNPASGRVLRKLGFRPTGATVSRHSAGRGAEAPCREFALELAGEAEAEAAEPCSMAA
jgi:RimJ/RimL family protein N-acetyltransferase